MLGIMGCQDAHCGLTKIDDWIPIDSKIYIFLYCFVTTTLVNHKN